MPYYPWGGYNDNYLSPLTTKYEKGISAIMIVMHHLSQNVSSHGILVVMQYVGFILVAIFFFISGYGLMHSFNNKHNYLHGFFKRRIITILVPYWIVNAISILIGLMIGRSYDLFEVIISFLGIDIITGTWFVTAILFMYILFYLSFSLTQITCKREKLGILILAIGIVFYCIICQLLNLHSSYTASVSAFFLGIVWACVGNIIAKWLRKKYILKLIFSIGLFELIFMGRLVLSLNGFDNTFIHMILRNIISVSFIICIILITQKVEFKGVILKWIGDISYELYIVHFVMLSILAKMNFNENLYVTVLLVGALSFSTVLRSIDKKIIRFLVHK